MNPELILTLYGSGFKDRLCTNFQHCVNKLSYFKSSLNHCIRVVGSMMLIQKLFYSWKENKNNFGFSRIHHFIETLQTNNTIVHWLNNAATTKTTNSMCCKRNSRACNVKQTMFTSTQHTSLNTQVYASDALFMLDIFR